MSPWKKGLRSFSEREEGVKRERREWGKGETKGEGGKGKGEKGRGKEKKALPHLYAG